MSSGRSPPHDAARNIAGNAELFYTNEDVAVLHNIVVLAQELLPTLPDRERLPTNALFNAYYDILPRVAVNADYDSRYARILFKIGGLRGDGTLYEKFEEILSRMGIEIEFDQDETGDMHSQAEHSQTSVEAATTGFIPQEERPSRGRQRRNSDSGAWNVESEHNHAHYLKQRRNSFSPPRKPLLSPETTGQREIDLSSPFEPSQTAGTSHGDLSQEVGAWVASMQEKPRLERGRSTSTHGGMRIRRRSPSVSLTRQERPASPPDVGLDEAQSPSYSPFASSNRQQKQDSLNVFRGQVIGHETETLMQTKASLVLQHHLSLIGKRTLQLWRDKAINAREHNATLSSLACRKDKGVLLGLALESWRSLLLERQHIAETERFFAHLERRSEQARNLYLLHKAFTHWGTSAFEEVERTSIARRHIIKTRTFNAWRDITAINELKVRRQVIKKFFELWKRQHDQLSSYDARIVQIYESNLVEKVFRQWFQKTSDIKATAWWSENAKRRALFSWTVLSRSAEGHRCAAYEIRLLQLARNAWQIWRAKTEDRNRRDSEARNLYEARIRSSTLRRWRRETRVLPAKKTLQTDVNLRVLRSKFALWLQRARQERQATAIDRLRITREAWTNWRHKLRFQVLCTRVDDHIILRSIYKWVLTERSVLAQRLVNQRLLLDCMQNWAQRSKTLREHRWDQEDLAQTVEVSRGRDLALRRWHSRLQTQQQQEADAASMYIPRRVGSTLSQWSERTRHVQELDRWSRDAEFYFLASKTLKRWKVSTEATKREKRKSAYIHVRRTMKMKLARGVLENWRRRTQEVRELHARALDVNQNRTVILGMNIFDRWRARMEEREELNYIWRQRVARKQFTLWRGRTAAFRDLEVEAIINYQERQQEHAIKKWGLSTLHLRSQSHHAAEIREKNLKRSFRKTFTYWHQRAVQKLPARSSHHDGSDLTGVTPRAEIWSESGDDTEVDEWARGPDDPNVFTPIPGYLKTPSRRLERVTAAAARFSSTTPRVPLPSPFDRHLRGRYLGSSLASARNGGQSSLGRGFEDIPEMGNDDGDELV